MRFTIIALMTLAPVVCFAQGAPQPQGDPTYSPTLTVRTLTAMQTALGKEVCTVLDAANRRCEALNAYLEMDAQIAKQNNDRNVAVRNDFEKQVRDRLAADAAKAAEAKAAETKPADAPDPVPAPAPTKE